MKILVLFDGAGLARLGLEQAGHTCFGVEMDPWKCYLGRMVGRGEVAQMDVLDFWKSDVVDTFDAIWASPPCARRTSCIKDLTKADGLRNPEMQHNYVEWCLSSLRRWSRKHGGLPYWVENVTQQGEKHLDVYNAAQFLKEPIQCRNRHVWGQFPAPKLWRPYKRAYPDLEICPTITATEYKASGATDKCRASRFYGRNLTADECAYHQGFRIPRKWWDVPSKFTPSKWRHKIFEAIGDGVPVYMAKAFGLALK